MQENIKHIIFDFDGTLADTTPVILGTMTATIEELGLPSKTEAECLSTIGIRLEDIPAELWPELGDISTRYATTYRRIFDEKKKDLRAVMFPGVVESLRELSDIGYDMAVATSRSRRSVEEYLAYFGIENLFCCVVGGNDVNVGKPSPEPVLAVCKATGWNSGECLVVGDAVYDIMMGSRAGSFTCAVTYGNQSRSRLETAAPTFIIDSFSGLLKVLGSGNRTD